MFVQIIFEPTMQELNDYLGSINTSIISSIARFPRLYEKFRLPKPEGMTSFADVIALDEEYDRLQHALLEELTHNKMQLMEYVDTWTPFKSIWEVDKALFFKALEPRSAKDFDVDITVYGETANQVQMQDTTIPVYFMDVYSFKLKSSIMAHIDQWRDGYIDVLKTKAYGRINSNYYNKISKFFLIVFHFRTL